MNISFVIPSYNSAQHFTDEKMKRLLSFGEVIVVDDGSTDNTREVVSGFSRVRYIHQENAGAAAARNTGWRAATGEVVCFIDADTSVDDDDFKLKILSGFDSDNIAAVGGSYTIRNPERILPRFIHEEIIERHAQLPDNPQFLGSYLLAVRKKVLEEINGFDDSYPSASGEDNDLCYRITDRGYKLRFVKTLSVGHQHTASLLKYLREQAWHGYFRMKLYRVHPSKMSGDDYSSILDFIQPPLAFLSIVVLALTCVLTAVFPMEIVFPLALVMDALFLIVLLLQFPFAFRNTFRLGRPVYLFIAVVTFLRAYARAFGMVTGFVMFFILTRPARPRPSGC